MILRVVHQVQTVDLSTTDPEVQTAVDSGGGTIQEVKKSLDSFGEKIETQLSNLEKCGAQPSPVLAPANAPATTA